MLQCHDTDPQRFSSCARLCWWQWVLLITLAAHGVLIEKRFSIISDPAVMARFLIFHLSISVLVPYGLALLIGSLFGFRRGVFLGVLWSCAILPWAFFFADGVFDTHDPIAK